MMETIATTADEQDGWQVVVNTTNHVPISWSSTINMHYRPHSSPDICRDLMNLFRKQKWDHMKVILCLRLDLLLSDSYVIPVDKWRTAKQICYSAYDPSAWHVSFAYHKFKAVSSKNQVDELVARLKRLQTQLLKIREDKNVQEALLNVLQNMISIGIGRFAENQSNLEIKWDGRTRENLTSLAGVLKGAWNDDEVQWKNCPPHTSIGKVEAAQIIKIEDFNHDVAVPTSFDIMKLISLHVEGALHRPGSTTSGTARWESYYSF